MGDGYARHRSWDHEQECPDFTNRVLDAARDVNDCLTNQDEIRATNVTLKRGSDVRSGVATGFASRGNRSTNDSGKRNSLSRERSFAEQKSIARDDRVTLGTGTGLAQVHSTM